jgi:putative transcriptional regulator
MKKLSQDLAYPSRILAAIHETAEDLHSVGILPTRTLREFDALCLTPGQPLTLPEIRQMPPQRKERSDDLHH